MLRRNIKDLLFYLEYNFAKLSNAKNKRIAVIKQGGLGDYVVFTAFLKNLRRLDPDSHITLFSNFDCMDMWKINPRIDKFIPIVSGQPLFSQGSLYLDQFLNPIKEVNKYFDIVYDPNHTIDYYFNGILASNLISNSRITFRKDKSVFTGYNPNEYYSCLLDVPFFDNVAHYNSHFLKTIYPHVQCDSYDTELFTLPEDRTRLLEKEKKIIGVHAVGSNNSRKLSRTKIIEVIKAIYSNNCEPLIIGQDIWGIKNEYPIFSDCITLREIFHCISQLSGLICVDSGIKHVGGVYKIPTIEISHIPDVLQSLNGPYISNQYQFTAVDYWRPCPGKYYYKVIKPQFIESAEDIESGKSINSFDYNELKEELSMLLKS